MQTWNGLLSKCLYKEAESEQEIQLIQEFMIQNDTSDIPVE